VALLRAILLTLNQSAIPGETPAVPPLQEGPSNEIVIVTCLMYASLLISLLAAFIAMLGKLWLNRYLRNSGGSMIERCGDRQVKCDGLEKWPLYPIVESLPVMLQAALLLLACGLCRYMWSINPSVARTLIGLTGLGVIVYIAVVIAGVLSYACPFQTPISMGLRGLWKTVRCATKKNRFKRVLSYPYRTWKKRVRPLPRRQPPPAIFLEDVQVLPPGPLLVFDNTLWMQPKELDIHRTNASDARCVSWILRNITDPEALDAAIRLAGEIRWFDDGTNVNLESMYGLIVSTFVGCFCSTGESRPGPGDRAYYSGRAMTWINALARCKSEELANRFPLPPMVYTVPVPDPNLDHLLKACFVAQDDHHYIEHFLEINPGHTPLHSQWISNLLLHHSWANQTELDYERILHCISRVQETKTTIPLNTILNRLLVWCIFLKSPVDEEVLKVQDKSYGISYFCSSSCSPIFISYHVESILYQLSNAVLLATGVNGTPTQRGFVRHMLRDLTKLETHPIWLTGIAYRWCSVICENRQNLQDWESLLLVCLEIGFRRLGFRYSDISPILTHTEHHRGLADVAFKSRESEVIADLLHAWTVRDGARELLSPCAEHLVGLHDLVPSSQRLRRFVIRTVEVIGYDGFVGVEVEKFIGLLNRLRVTVKDMDKKENWEKCLMDTIQSSDGRQHLSHWYWELLVELAISGPDWLNGIAYSPQITASLVEAQEWSKLECWMGIFWMVWPPGSGGVTEVDLGRPTLLLCRQRPEAVQKLEKWVKRWSQTHDIDIPESFKQICEQAHQAAQQDAP
jgi:hypothetical protein